MRHSWSLILIIVLGFFIRLAGLTWGQGYSDFSAVDSFEAYSFSVDYARGEPRAQYIDQPNYNEHAKLPGPLWNLFCFATARFWGSVDGIILATILLNTVAIYLIYLLAERTIGSPGSLWAALLAATLPFPIYYSTFVYNPNVMSFLGALLFLALWDVSRKDRSRHIFWVAFLPLLMLQFHLSGLSLLPAIIIVLALAPVRLNARWLLGGLFAGALLYLAYIRGEMAHDWHNTRGMFSGRNGHWWGGLKAVIAPWNLLVNYVPQWMDSTDDYRRLGRACFGSFAVLLALNLFSGIIAVVLLLGAVCGIIKASRGLLRSPRETFQKSPGILFLGILLVVPLFCSLISRQSFHSRYAIILLPALLCLAGSAVVQWASYPKFRRIFLAAMALLTCANIYFMPALYWYQGNTIEHGEKFHASFHNLETIYQRLKTHAGPGRAVEVDDAAFLKAFATDKDLLRDVGLIHLYVDTREKEAAALSGSRAQPVIYTLYAASQTTPQSVDVVYQAHGLTLAVILPSR
jgi:hypothetical protein